VHRFLTAKKHKVRRLYPGIFSNQRKINALRLENGVKCGEIKWKIVTTGGKSTACKACFDFDANGS
jgi:hypothetical protein